MPGRLALFACPPVRPPSGTGRAEGHHDQDASEASTVQVHADADNMAFHMQLVGDHIRRSAEYLDFSSMKIKIYGSPSEAVLDQMRQLAGSGVPVTISPAAVGFNRFPAS